MSSTKSIDETISKFWEIEDELRELEPEEIIERLPKNILPLVNYHAPLRLTNRQWIYRARPNEATYMQGDGKKLIKNYRYAPPEHTEQGRANLAKKPMFYGSEYISATAFEARANMEEDSLVGCWRIKPKSPEVKLAICACLFRPEIGYNMQKYLSEPLLSKIKFLDKIFSHDRDKKLWVEYRDGVQTKKESAKDKIHSITAAVAQHLIERENVDGIVYHSAQAQGAKAVFEPSNNANWLFNLAITPAYVDQHLVLEKVYRVRINSYDDELGRRRATRSAIEIGIPVDDKILEFQELDDMQNQEFELEHNQCGVPMLLKGRRMLTIENLENASDCQKIVDSLTCGEHGIKAKLQTRLFDEVPGVTIETCCDELCTPLQQKLRDAGIWID